MYAFHPGVLKIKENVKIVEKFNFKNISSNQIKDEINKFNPRKACIGNDIPTKIFIGNSDIICEPISNIYSNSKNKQDYLISLIVADVTPVLKPNEKNEKTCNKNYRPVSLISIV